MKTKTVILLVWLGIMRTVGLSYSQTIETIRPEVTNVENWRSYLNFAAPEWEIEQLHETDDFFLAFLKSKLYPNWFMVSDMPKNFAWQFSQRRLINQIVSFGDGKRIPLAGNTFPGTSPYLTMIAQNGSSAMKFDWSVGIQFVIPDSISELKLSFREAAPDWVITINQADNKIQTNKLYIYVFIMLALVFVGYFYLRRKP